MKDRKNQTGGQTATGATTTVLAIPKAKTAKQYYPFPALYSSATWSGLASLQAILNKDISSYTKSAQVAQDLNRLKQFINLPPMRESTGKIMEVGDYFVCRSALINRGQSTILQLDKLNPDASLEGTQFTVSGSPPSLTATTNKFPSADGTMGAYKTGQCRFYRSQIGGSERKQEGGQVTLGMTPTVRRETNPSLPVVLFNLNRLLTRMAPGSSENAVGGVSYYDREIAGVDKIITDLNKTDGNPYIPTQAQIRDIYKQSLDRAIREHTALKTALATDKTKVEENYSAFKESITALQDIQAQAASKETELEQRLEELKMEEGAFGGGGRVSRKRSRKVHRAHGRKGSRKN